MLTSAKLRGSWHSKVYFLKLLMCLYLRAKFEVSSIILTSFRQGVILLPPPLPHPPPKNETIKSPPRLGLISPVHVKVKKYMYKKKINSGYYKNSVSSKRSEVFKNLIVDFKVDRFVLTLKYCNPHKRMFKSFSSG